MVRSNSPSLGMRRGTFADVRSLGVRKTVVIEGFLQLKRAKSDLVRYWFQLDQSGPE
jgi:hypothetical protein